jgi:hypothetical protein
MKSIDPLLLQRLVDGELDPPQIQQILADATTAPEQWQEIAVGFVENQTWDRAFQSFESGNSTLPTAADAVAADERVADEDAIRQTKPSSGSIHRRSRPSWLVLAASLLAAATIGYMVNHIQNRDLPSSNLAKETLEPSEPLLASKIPDSQTPNPQMTPAMLQPDYHLEVPQDNEYLRDVMAAGPVAPVPLYRIGNAEQLKLLNQQRAPAKLPPEILQDLAGSGYQMQQDIDFISGRLDDGRSFVVPVRTIRFVPGQ